MAAIYGVMTLNIGEGNSLSSIPLCLPLGLVIFALEVCFLSSGDSPTAPQYSLVNWKHETIDLV